MNITHTAIYTSNVVDNEVVFTTYLTSLMLSLCSLHKAMMFHKIILQLLICRDHKQGRLGRVDQPTQSLVKANDKK